MTAVMDAAPHPARDTSARLERYLALGDSLTEGKGDPDPAGGLRGFADLLALGLARTHPQLQYANLARPSVRVAEVLAHQVPRIPQYSPDLITVIAGVNDVIALHFNPDRMASRVEALFGAARRRAPAAAILTATLPDIAEISDVGRLFRGRVRQLNAITRATAARHGIRLVDLHHDVQLTAEDLALDRVHPGPRGHHLLASAFATALGVAVPTAPEGPTCRTASTGERLVRTVLVAPRFVVRRLDRRRLIAGQPPKRPLAAVPVARPPRVSR
ncbi:SGNH/GDSL hydrolase family protein [Euzebya tangerina]|uniref:SGNH/GDSL hydrolase family protein n=1 Tax=Euzebya tangerina TaxID=591198 RepID=UPI000E30F687|nr:SGNH/GDSL hydrolase family protein [Euzebya tangerina]